MRIFFATDRDSCIAETNPSILGKIRNAILNRKGLVGAEAPDEADAIVLEEKGSYKDFRYIEKLKSDPFVSQHAGKIFVINTDDCATGLFRGLYTSLPKTRIDLLRHRIVPYLNYPNELALAYQGDVSEPPFLATWRGNAKSNIIRRRMLSTFAHYQRFSLQQTDSWLNHQQDEKALYVRLILDGKFSLCPGGWAPVTYRIYESMALGRCPVIIADQFVPPAGPDWNQFALFFPEREIRDLDVFLQTNEFRSQELGERARQEWNCHFNAEKIGNYYAEAMVSLITTAAQTSAKNEFQRWHSLRVYWDNRWTIPQRIANKARKWGNRITEKSPSSNRIL